METSKLEALRERQKSLHAYKIVLEKVLANSPVDSKAYKWAKFSITVIGHHDSYVKYIERKERR